MNDKEEAHHIIEYLKRGSRKSFGWLFKKHFPYIRKSAFQYESYLAQHTDLINEVCVKLLTHVPESKSPETFDFRNYFSKSVKNLYLDKVRHHKMVRRNLKWYDQEVVSEIYKEPNMNELIGGLKNIPEKQRDIVLMRLKGIPFHEIAEIMDISTNTATGSFRCARLSLAALADKVIDVE